VAAQPLLAEALRRFQSGFPEVQIDLIAMRSKNQREDLRKGRIDVGFFYAEAGDEDVFDWTPVMTDDFLLALPEGHRLASKARITLDDLRGEPLIFPSKWHAPSTHERLMAAFRERGIAPTIVAENPSADILNCLVSAGIGLGFLITSQKDRAPATVVAREVADFSLPLPLVLAWLKDNRSPIIPNFVAAAKPVE